jgi:alpha-beta hydrolase superfamily lysophospholipase
VQKKFTILFLLIIFVISLKVTAYAETLIFEHNQQRLYGQYLTPYDLNKNEKPKAVLLFVHGDGDMPYNADGYYDIIWESLRIQGYAVFSWDKPGIGESEGNWLNQSMQDRQSETLAAIEAVQKKYQFKANNTGLIGFSQAGWVLPVLSNDKAKIGFAVGIGFARNWVNQGIYYTRTRLAMDGANEKKIINVLKSNGKEILFLDRNPTYEEYLKNSGEVPMTKSRYQFVLKNYRSDATSDYSKISVPTLLLWGNKDLNVNAKGEFRWWNMTKNKNPFVNTHLINNAGHGMLDAESFDSQIFSVSQWIKLMWLEEKAFAPRFMPKLLSWLEQRTLKESKHVLLHIK